MTSLKSILMSSAAALSLAAAPALAQQAETSGGGAEQSAAQGAGTERSYDEAYTGDFAAWGDRNVDELLGTTVVNDEGETIGEISNLGLSGEQIVAIVGVGGFLGLGEHSVAVPFSELAFEGEQLVLLGVTREELEAMPEYNEGDAQTFAGDATLRSGYETAEGGDADTAAVQPSDNPAADQPMEEVEEEVADAAEADREAEADLAEGETSVDEAEPAEPMAESSGEATDTPPEDDAAADAAPSEAGETESAEAGAQDRSDEGTAGEDAAAAADTAEAGAEMPTPDNEQEMATSEEEQPAEAEAPAEDAGQSAETTDTDAPEDEVEMAASDEEQPAAEAEAAQTETEEPSDAGSEMAADEETPTDEEPVTETAGTDISDDAEAADEMAPVEDEGPWTEEMDSIFADIADQQIVDLIGMDVASAEGEVVGEIDNFALQGEDLVAIVGVGGFLGIGERDVALALQDMTFDGERLVLSSITEEQVHDMPEVEEAETNNLPQDGTLRSVVGQ